MDALARFLAAVEFTQTLSLAKLLRRLRMDSPMQRHACGSESSGLLRFSEQRPHILVGALILGFLSLDGQLSLPQSDLAY